MKIHNQVQQGTLAWTMLHIGRPTASEFKNILTPKFEKRTGEMPLSYLCSKVAEAYRGKPLAGFTSWATEQGTILEDEARPWFEFSQDAKVDQVGFVESDCGRYGCSPDGLIGEDGGIEIKCPMPHTHTKYLINNSLPDEYATQVHGSLFVTGRKWWKFLSYCRKFPPLLITVHRDEEIVAKISKAVTAFCDRFDTELAKLRALES